MNASTAASRDDLLGDLVGLLTCLDGLLGELGPEAWGRAHGRRWTMADMPTHLHFFYGDIVLESLRRGPNVAPSERWVVRTLAELDAWNDARRALVPPETAGAERYAEMRGTLLAVRATLTAMREEDLDRAVWWPLLAGRGWRTARFAFEWTVAHTWEHATEARLRLGRQGPPAPECATHRALGSYMQQTAGLLDRDRSARRGLTTTLAFSGPGGGEWTLYAADGSCGVKAGRLGVSDLVLEMSPETYVRCFLSDMRSPGAAMLRREIRVRGPHHLGTFRRLFPLSPTRVWEPIPEGSAPAPT